MAFRKSTHPAVGYFKSRLDKIEKAIKGVWAYNGEVSISPDKAIFDLNISLVVTKHACHLSSTQKASKFHLVIENTSKGKKVYYITYLPIKPNSSPDLKEHVYKRLASEKCLVFLNENKIGIKKYINTEKDNLYDTLETFCHGVIKTINLLPEESREDTSVKPGVIAIPLALEQIIKSVSVPTDYDDLPF